MTGTEWTGGSLRLLYSFSAGLLLFRLFKPVNIKGSFWLCGISLAILLAMPRLGGEDAFWMNSLYETVCFAVFFPLILLFGASGKSLIPIRIKYAGSWAESPTPCTWCITRSSICIMRG